MKRFLLLIVVLLSLLGTVGCLDNKEVDKSTPNPATILAEDNSKVNLTDNKKKTSQSETSQSETVKNETTQSETAQSETTQSETAQSETPQSETTNNVNDDFQDISSFIPKGWHILKNRDGELALAEGDLNKDGIIDKAFIIEESIVAEENTEYLDSPYALNSPRNLLIVFGNKDNTYTLSIKAEKAILLGCEGGGYGDPFQSIGINRGTITLENFGGSSRWSENYRFRYQNKGWYLIGYTVCSYENTGTEIVVLTDDYNLLTGNYIDEELANGKIKTNKGNRGKRKLLNLKDLNSDTVLDDF